MFSDVYVKESCVRARVPHSVWCFLHASQGGNHQHHKHGQTNRVSSSSSSSEHSKVPSHPTSPNEEYEVKVIK